MIRFAGFLLSALALLGLGAGGALFLAPGKLQLIVNASAESERAVPPPPAPDRTDEVLARVDSLREALAAFATALDESAEERAALTAQLTAERTDAARARTDFRERFDDLVRRVGEIRAEPVIDAPPAPKPVAAAPEPEPKPEPVLAPKPRRKSLAALLAARKRTDVRDEAANWKLSAGHCRVGFDGVSTIHNFTARSDAVEGSFRLHFRQPSDKAGGTLRLRVASLESGNVDRDEAIHRHLAGDDGGASGIDCEILAIDAPDSQQGDQRTATARIRFRIHGKTHEVQAPLKLEFTAQRLLHVTGETTLLMSDFDIHPKAKLGVIKVDDKVTVWWDLYAEVDRAKG